MPATSKRQLKSCKAGQVRNPKTNRCIKAAASPKTRKNKKLSASPIPSSKVSSTQFKPNTPKQMETHRNHTANNEVLAFASQLFDLDDKVENNERIKQTDYYKALVKTYMFDGRKQTGVEICKAWTNSVLTANALNTYDEVFGVYNPAYTARHAAENGVTLTPGDISSKYTIYVTKPELKKLEIYNAQLKVAKAELPKLTSKHDKEMAKLFEVWLDVMFEDLRVEGYTSAECDKYSNIINNLTIKYLFTLPPADIEDYQKKAIIGNLMAIMRELKFRSACKDAFDVYRAEAIYYILAHLR